MMKLTRPTEPEQLIKQKETLTREYIENNKKIVWRKDYIISPLYESSHKKCAYCENDVIWNGDETFEQEMDEVQQSSLDTGNSENNFLHIDHFVARKHDSTKVVDWNNLIPACPTCNYKKAAHDVIKIPIINPYEDDPKHFFTFNNHCLCIKLNIDSNSYFKAEKTIAVFRLSDRLIRNIGTLNASIHETLGKLHKDINTAIKTFKQDNDVSTFNDLIESIEKLLKWGLPSCKYGAFIATLILNHNYYSYIKHKLVENDLWSAKLSSLENQLKEICYEQQ